MKCYFVVVQTPLCDLRPLLREPTGRLLVPSWPDPVPGEEFIRSVGPVRERGRGSIAGWTGERSFVDAKGLVRFVSNGHGSARESTRSSRLVLGGKYRRIYGDDLLLRLDLGFLVWSRENPDDSEIVSAVMDWPVSVPSAKGFVTVAVQDIGTPVANALRVFTSVQGKAIPSGEIGALTLTAQRQMVLVERPMAGHRTEKITVGRRDPRFPKVPVISFSRPSHTVSLPVRQWRGSLWRLHGELETLRQVHRKWRRHGAAFDEDALLVYLEQQLRVLARKRRNGILQPRLIGLSDQMSRYQLADFDRLADELRERSKGLARRAELIAERGRAALRQDRFLGSGEYVIIGGTVSHTENNFNFHDKAAGVFGSENLVEGGTFVAAQQSVAGDLRSAVEELLPHLQDADRQAAASALEEIEAAGGEPGRIRRALESIADIARTAGEVGAPVIEAVKSVTQAISG